MNDDPILTAAAKLRERFLPQFQSELPEWAFVTAILDWQQLVESDISDDTLSSDAFLNHLGEHVRRFREADMFTGGRTFSFEKLAAMTSLIISRGHDMSKTKLNKLLFYADFVNYFLHEKSISGSRYIHMPYGPVAEYYRETLETLSEQNKLHTERVHGHDELIYDGTEALEVLSLLEVASLKWVIENLDDMTAREISEFSHHEMAFRFTRYREFIPYKFSKYFKKLPDPSPPSSIKPINGH